MTVKAIDDRAAVTVKMIEDTAATASQSPRPDTEDTASTAQKRGDQPITIGRVGPFMATVVLLVGLGAGPNAWKTPDFGSNTARRRDEYESEASTEADAEVAPELLAEVRDLFERGATEFFQDGVHSAFSRALLAFLECHGSNAFRAIAEYLRSGVLNPDVVSEALRWLGDFGDVSTLRDRWTVLQQMLRHHSPRVRDGAILGFAALDHPRAKPVLMQARDVEQIAELRRLIEQVIAQLDGTEDAAIADRRSGKPLD